jgi:hypothetical protein
MTKIGSAPQTLPRGFEDVLSFPLSAAIFGRRARRFSMGATIPDGPLAFESKHEPMPLTELEQMLVLSAAGGNTGWHYAITRNETYAPHLANYAGAAGGRTFPSAAGFHTSELFFTNDDGTYVFETRNAPALVERDSDGSMDVEQILDAHRSRIKKLYDGRMNIPAEEPYMEGHNTWCVNRPGTTLIMPIADLAQHDIAGLCFLVQNGACIYDDLNDRKIPGIERFASLVNVEEPFPLSYFDQYMLTEATAEIATACYAGMLMLQAMGLGGWMFDGVDRHTTLGATGDPEVAGFGFRYDNDERWPIPNVTGLPGVFEGYCPPHYPDMRAAVEAFAERKFGAGGPFNAATPGAWRDSPKIRGSAQVHNEEFIDCVTTQAQYCFDTFGKFPATVPSMFSLMYLQAHHLDLDFYDHHFEAGGYLRTHAEHMENWHHD